MSPARSPIPLKERLLLLGHSTYVPLMVAAELFLMTFVLRSTADVAALVPFRIGTFLAITVVFITGGIILVKAGFLWVYRTGFLGLLTLFIGLIFWGEAAGKHLFLFGSVYGIGLGAYWVSYHIYKMGMTSRVTRVVYLSNESLIGQCANIVAPAFFGWLIALGGGYLWFFVFAAMLAVAGFVVSEWMEQHRPVQDYRLDLRGYLQILRRDRQIRWLLFSMFMSGFGMWGGLTLFVRLLMFLAVHTEMMLGLAASVLPLFPLATVWIVRHSPHHRYRAYALGCGALMMIAPVSLIWGSSPLAVLTYAVIITTFTAPSMVIISLAGHNLIDRSPELKQYTVVHFVVMESVLNVGRVLSMLPFVWISGMSLAHSTVLALSCFFGLVSIASAFGVVRAYDADARP